MTHRHFFFGHAITARRFVIVAAVPAGLRVSNALDPPSSACTCCAALPAALSSCAITARASTFQV